MQTLGVRFNRGHRSPDEKLLRHLLLGIPPYRTLRRRIRVPIEAAL